MAFGHPLLQAGEGKRRNLTLMSPQRGRDEQVVSFGGGETPPFRFAFRYAEFLYPVSAHLDALSVLAAGNFEDSRGKPAVNLDSGVMGE